MRSSGLSSKSPGRRRSSSPPGHRRPSTNGRISSRGGCSKSLSKDSMRARPGNCSRPAAPGSKRTPSSTSSPRPTDIPWRSRCSPRAGSTQARWRRNDTSSRRSWRASTIPRRNRCGPSRSCDGRPGPAAGARAGDLEAALLRVPRSPRLDGILVETEVFLGKFAEARAALERIGESGGQLERLRARIQLGRIENRLGAYKEARAVLEAAAGDAAAVHSPEIEGEALRALGGVERKLGDLDAAIAHLGRATDVLPNGSRERVRALTDLGVALIARDDIPGAKARLLEAAATVRRATREDAVIQINLGIVTSREGDPRTAAATFARSADIALATGEIRFAAYALANAV